MEENQMSRITLPQGGTQVCRTFAVDFSHNNSHEGTGRGSNAATRREVFSTAIAGTPALEWVGFGGGGSVRLLLPWPGGLSFDPAPAAQRIAGIDPFRAGFYGEGGIYPGEVIDRLEVITDTTVSAVTITWHLGANKGQQFWAPSGALVNGTTNQALATWALAAPDINWASPNAAGDECIIQNPNFDGTVINPFAVIEVSGGAAGGTFFEMGGAGAGGVFLDDPIHIAANVRKREANELAGYATFAEFPSTSNQDIGDVFQMNVPGIMRDLERQVPSMGANFQFGIGLEARDCQVAFMHPNRIVFIDDGDVAATGDNTIPPAVADNTSTRFRSFPGCFFRRTEYIRGVGIFTDELTVGQTNAEGYSLTTDIAVNSPMTLQPLVRNPTHTRWGLVIDGQYTEAIFEHPAGSNLRRARDAWNEVIVPAIETSQRIGGGVEVHRPMGDAAAAPAAVTFPVTGILNRMQYLQYAVLLQHYDDSIVPIYGPPITQTGVVE